MFKANDAMQTYTEKALPNQLWGRPFHKWRHTILG